jgi:hypothetical protein
MRLGTRLQIKSTIMPQEGPPVLGQTPTAPGPIQWQWSEVHFGPKNPPIQHSWSRPKPSPCVGQTLQIKSTQSCLKDLQYWGRLTCPRTPSSGGSGLSPFWPKSPQFNHLGRPKPSPCVGADVADQNQSCHTKGPPVLGRLPPAPGTHPVVAVVSLSPFWPKSPNSIIWSRPSHLHTFVGADVADQINSIMPQEGPPVLGDSHLPPGTHPVVAVVSVSHLAQIPKFNHLSQSKAISMRWSRRCRSNQLNHATRTLRCWVTPAPGTHPVVAVVSVSPFGPNPPKFNHLSRPSHLHALEQTLQIKSNNHATRGLQYWDSHLPQGPIQWWQWSLEPIFYPQFNHLGRPSHLHALEQTFGSNQLNHATRRTSVLGRLPPAPGTHPVVAVVSEPILAKIPVQSF